nr:DNA translocase FtsK [uncultured Marinifilum sp.]
MISSLDSLFKQAAHFIVENQLCSIKLVQEQFSIGSKRATRIVKLLEQAGVISMCGSSSDYKILIPTVNLLIEKLEQLELTDFSLNMCNQFCESDIKTENEIDTLDLLFYKAAQIVIENQDCSFSFLQRRLSIGYNRAKAIINQLQQKGVIVYSTNKEDCRVLLTEGNSLNKKLKK